MKVKQDQVMWISIIAVAILIILPYLGLAPSFSIVDTTIILTELGEVNQNGSLDIFQTLSSEEDIVSFIYLNDTYQYPNGIMLYLLDNSSFLYENIIELSEGEHTLTKYQLTTREIVLTEETNETRIVVSKGSKSFYNAIQTVEVEVPGEIKYVNQTVYMNKTINNTITKEVQIAPSILERYGLAGVIFVFMGLIIIYLIYKRTR